MSEDQIEMHVERSFDRLDASLMSGAINDAEYDAEVIRITQWASRQYGLKTTRLNFLYS